MALPLPDMSKVGDASDILQRLIENRQIQPHIELMKAQAEEAKGAAQKNAMFANLINEALGLGGTPSTAMTQPSRPSQPSQPMQAGGMQPNIAQGGYLPTSEEQKNIAQMKPGEAITVGQPGAGMPGTTAPNTRQQKAKDILYALGMLHETPSEQANRETTTAFNKDVNSSDIKQLEKWNDIVTASESMMPNLENIRDISANPVFQNMYKNPEFFGHDIAWLKRFGSPKEQDLLTRLGTNSKDIFQSTASEFKGAFREFEMKLFQKLVPDERDTLQQIISKNNAVIALREVAIKRFNLANQIVRDMKGQVSAPTALQIARKQIPTKPIQEQVDREFKESEKRQRTEHGMPEEKLNDKPLKSNIENGEMVVVDPSGKEHIILRDNWEAAKKKYPDLKIKKESFNAARI